MPVKDLLRGLRDGPLARERLRRANRGAHITSQVIFSGDATRTRLGAEVTVAGPTALYVTDGGGLSGAFLEIGEGSYIGEFANIRCAGAPIRIGAKCLIGQHVTIVGSNHAIATGTPIVDQPWSGNGVTIGDDVWLGAGCVVLPGADIGSGAVAGANSVIRGRVEPGAIVVGSPARVVGQRQ